MMKFFLSGAILFAGLSLAIEDANAATPVIAQCPVATWTTGYNLWELIPLAESQYKPAIVTEGLTNIRAGMGFESEVVFTLDGGTQVMVVGEAWDGGCNQWMYVRIGSNLYWVHGHQIQLL
ncbi:MAG: hypothetical protein F6J95_017540 [Leptolyngbya sp. SIO1E4]|nr:hypothetical protein [Leptolyngbya sp. SIO1E4]